MVAGQRAVRRDSLLRKVSSTLANRLRSRLLHDQTRDTGCGLKLLRRDAFCEMPYFDHMHRFLPALMQRAGYDCRFVDVHHRPRAAGRSKYGIRNRLWVGIVDLLGVMWLRRRRDGASREFKEIGRVGQR
jgi:dolichol-phosphate mannosyltransferase